MWNKETGRSSKLDLCVWFCEYRKVLPGVRREEAGSSTEPLREMRMGAAKGREDPEILSGVWRSVLILE